MLLTPVLSVLCLMTTTLQAPTSVPSTVPVLDARNRPSAETSATHESTIQTRRASMGSGDQAWRTWPLKVTLVGVNKEQFAPGETVFFEVELEALEATDVPWSLSAVPTDRGSPTARRGMMVVLSTGDDKHAKSLRAVVQIQGTSDQEGSLLHLEKGQRARILTSAVWWPDREKAPVSSRVRATVMPTEGETILAPISSANARVLRTAP